MSVASYLELLDWTARTIRSDKCGATPANFERLGISGEVWCAIVRDFGRLFYAVAGQPYAIDSYRSRNRRSPTCAKQYHRLDPPTKK